jgi:hypothetical protein
MKDTMISFLVIELAIQVVIVVRTSFLSLHSSIL